MLCHLTVNLPQCFLKFVFINIKIWVLFKRDDSPTELLWIIEKKNNGKSSGIALEISVPHLKTLKLFFASW